MIIILTMTSLFGLLALSYLNRLKINELQEQIDFNDYNDNFNTRLHILERETGVQRKEYYYRTYITDSNEYGRRYHHIIYFGFNDMYSNKELDVLYKDEVLFNKVFTKEEFDKFDIVLNYTEVAEKHKAKINE